MQKHTTDDNIDTIGMLIKVSTVLLAITYLCSCTNGRAYVGYESVDEIKRSESTDKPSKNNYGCLFFFNCKES